MSNHYTLDVTIADGKYTIRQDITGKFYALRYGKRWQELTGNTLIYSLAAEVETLRDRIKYLEEKLNGS